MARASHAQLVFADGKGALYAGEPDGEPGEAGAEPAAETLAEAVSQGGNRP